MEAQCNCRDTRQNVSLGCGTLILIALIVMIFGNSGKDNTMKIDRIQNQLQQQEQTIREMQDTLNRIEQRLNALPVATPMPPV